jgi:hypothetical protein
MLGHDVASAEAGWRFLNALRDTENLAEAQQRCLPNAARSPTRPAGRVDRSGADRRIGLVFLKSPLTIRRMTAPSSTLQACSCCATSTGGALGATRPIRTRRLRHHDRIDGSGVDCPWHGITLLCLTGDVL